MNQLEEIKARAERASKGPWFRDSTIDGGEVTENVVARSWDVARCPGADTHPDGGRAEQANADADFIAHARTDIPKLIAALEAVEEACTKVDRESSEAEQDWLAWAIENAIKEALQ